MISNLLFKTNFKTLPNSCRPYGLLSKSFQVIFFDFHIRTGKKNKKHMLCSEKNAESHTDQKGYFILHAVNTAIQANDRIVKDENMFSDCLVVFYHLHQISLKLTHWYNSHTLSANPDAWLNKCNSKLPVKRFIMAPRLQFKWQHFISDRKSIGIYHITGAFLQAAET